MGEVSSGFVIFRFGEVGGRGVESILESKGNETMQVSGANCTIHDISSNHVFLILRC